MTQVTLMVVNTTTAESLSPAVGRSTARFFSLCYDLPAMATASISSKTVRQRVPTVASITPMHCVFATSCIIAMCWWTSWFVCIFGICKGKIGFIGLYTCTHNHSTQPDTYPWDIYSTRTRPAGTGIPAFLYSDGHNYDPYNYRKILQSFIFNMCFGYHRENWRYIHLVNRFYNNIGSHAFYFAAPRIWAI